MLHEVNPYVHIYQQAGLILREKPSLQINIVLKSNYDIDKRFNLPTSDEIAVLMIENETKNKINHRDIVISRKSLTPEQEVDQNFNKLMFINENIFHYDPLHYVTMFPHGDAGWQNGTIPKKINLMKNLTKMTLILINLSQQMSFMHTCLITDQVK